MHVAMAIIPNDQCLPTDAMDVGNQHGHPTQAAFEHDSRGKSIETEQCTSILNRRRYHEAYHE